jgi:hypothetical protein
MKAGLIACVYGVWQVGASPVLNFPVLQDEPNRTIAVAPNDIIAPMQARPYTFGFWFSFSLTRTHAPH